MAVLNKRRTKKRARVEEKPPVRTRKKQAPSAKAPVATPKKAVGKKAVGKKAVGKTTAKTVAKKTAAKASAKVRNRMPHSVNPQRNGRKGRYDLTPKAKKAKASNAIKALGFDVLTKRTACNGLLKQGSMVTTEKNLERYFGEPFDVSRDTRSTAAHRWNLAVPQGIVSIYGPFGNLDGPQAVWHIGGVDSRVLGGLRKIFERKNQLKVAGSIEKYVRRGGPRSARDVRASTPPIPRKSARATKEAKEKEADEQRRVRREKRERAKLRTTDTKPKVRKTTRAVEEMPAKNQRRGRRVDTDGAPRRKVKVRSTADTDGAPARRKKLKRRRLATV